MEACRREGRSKTHHPGILQETTRGIDTHWLRIRADWTEQGKATKFEAIKACRFSKNDKELYFELTVSPVSAESGDWANYRMVGGDKLELHKIPQIAVGLGIDLSGNYQRPKAEKKGWTKGNAEHIYGLLWHGSGV